MIKKNDKKMKHKMIKQKMNENINGKKKNDNQNDKKMKKKYFDLAQSVAASFS